MNKSKIVLIIPAYNEALSLPDVLANVPGIVTHVIVADNGSTDGTGEIALSLGARVVYEPRPGYGNACMAAIAALDNDPPDIVAFADGDGSDGVENLPVLLKPLMDAEADMTLAQRMPETEQALTPQQRFGNMLSVTLIRLFWGYRYKDLGPMRALTWQALKQINMSERAFGWTVEMQIKAAKLKMRVIEFRLPYRTRKGGASKVSRTLKGVVFAGMRILWVIAKELLAGNRTVCNDLKMHTEIRNGNDLMKQKNVQGVTQKAR
ncbi:MAG: glycosyltransferase family 2 protein [Spirochaetota bacterium]